MPSSVLGSTAQEDAILSLWSTARVEATIKLVYRVFGSWDPDAMSPEGDDNRVLGPERLMPATVPKSIRVCAGIDRTTGEDQEQVMLAFSTTPP
jgi:hypothetical protein